MPKGETLEEFLNEKLCNLLELKKEELTPQKLHDLRENLKFKPQSDFCTGKIYCEGCGTDDCLIGLKYITPAEWEQIEKDADEFLRQFDDTNYKKSYLVKNTLYSKIKNYFKPKRF